MAIIMEGAVASTLINESISIGRAAEPLSSVPGAARSFRGISIFPA